MSKKTIHIDKINAMKQTHIERGYTDAEAYRMAIRELGRKHPEGFTISMPNIKRQLTEGEIGFIDLWELE